MKHLFLILALTFTFQAKAQDEIPTPEAFAKDCVDHMISYMQQVTEIVSEARSSSDEVKQQLGEDIEAAFARFQIKGKFCNDMSKLLGADYVYQLDKRLEDSEFKLAIYKLGKLAEQIKLQNAPKLDAEDIDELTDESSETNLPAKGKQRKKADLRARLKAEENQQQLNSLREAHILAIRQKVERNWRKPPGSGRMPICEVTVVQGPGGIILDVTFGACGGSTATYRASIENAVYKAEPLPAPGDPALFERELTFLFNPEQ